MFGKKKKTYYFPKFNNIWLGPSNISIFVHGTNIRIMELEKRVKKLENG